MNIILILKGFIVGLGKIIPGVSGSMLACTLGIYEPIIDAVTNFFNKPKKNIKLLLNFGIGVFLAIIIFSKIILFLLNNYYAPTMYLILGLIIGTIIPFTKNIKFNKKNIFLFSIFFFLTLSLIFLTPCSNFTFKPTLFNYLYTIILGIIDAFTSIVPGISGTAIFMLLGVYEFVLNVLEYPFSILFLIYTFGVIIGVIVICYIMNYLFKHHKESVNVIIYAFMLSSMSILFLRLQAHLNLITVFMFIIGSIIGYLFDR